MNDEPEETVVEVESKPASSYEPPRDTSLADSLSASLPRQDGKEAMDSVIAEQAEKRKLRPLIVGVGLMAAVGAGVVAVHVLKAVRTNRNNQN
jgi:hypothetical protein